MRRSGWRPSPAQALLPGLAVTPAPVSAPALPNASPISSHSFETLEHFAPVELAVFEVSGFPALLLPALPAAWLILAETLPAVHGAAECIRFAFASDAENYRAARALGMPTFNAFEWTTIASAAELDRVSFRTTARWLARKAAEPGLLFTPERCIGVSLDQPDRRSLSVGQAMAAMGGRLVKAVTA